LGSLVLLSALAVGLMVADRRWAVAVPLRNAVATALYPIQWALVQPVHAWQSLRENMVSLQATQAQNKQLSAENLQLSQQGQRAKFLELENAKLRELLALPLSQPASRRATLVAYRVADPYSKRVVIRHGTRAGVQEGDAVVDAHGVYGQVTHAYPFSAEVTLLTDSKQHTPVMSARSGATGVLVGSGINGAALELQLTATGADFQEGDTLVTNGLDGVYPAGLPVATIVRMDRSSTDQHAELILAKPLALVDASRYLMVVSVPAASTEVTPPKQEQRP
jgi:rod shape-determining protein MreC